MEDKEKTAMTADELQALVAKGVKDALDASKLSDEDEAAKTKAAVEAAIAAEKAHNAERADDEETETFDPNKAFTSATEPDANKYAKRGPYPKGDKPEDVKLATGMFYKDIMSASGPGRENDRIKEWGNFGRRVKVWLNEGTDEQGGYLVPADIGQHIRADALEDTIVRGSGARVYPLRGNRITISADVDETHATTFFGGVTVYRPAEHGVKTESKPTFRQIELTLHKLVVLVRATDEVMEDSVLALEQDITYKAGQAISFQEDDDFINGTGVGMALGLMNHLDTGGGAVITQAIQPLQPAATIVFENIVDMWTSLYARARNPVWLMNKNCFPQLASMNMAVGAGGWPVWMPAGGISGLPYQTLMGIPIIYTEKCQTLGTMGDIILVDWSQYAIAEKAGGIQSASSMHVYFTYDEQLFRFVLRYDGQPTWRVPLTPHNGTVTSPYVVLHTRS